MSTQTIARPLSHARPNGGSGTPSPFHLASRLPQLHMTEIFHPWSSRMWPCSPAEEASFVVDLNRTALTTTTEFDRRDVTALVTALRCGLSAEELLDAARGLKPSRLVAAYVELDRRRSISAGAWLAVTEDGTLGALEQYMMAASLLLPGILGQVVRDVRRTGDAQRVIVGAAARVNRATGEVLALEQGLDHGVTTLRAREIGALLNDGHETGAWNLEAFLPSRVGSLMPLRVAALLGEQRLNGSTARW